MSNPLDTIVYDNGASYLPIKTFYGNDDSILVTFPFDTATYEFTGEVVDQFSNVLQTMTVTKITTGTAPNLVYKANFALTSEQNKAIPEGSFILLKWVQGGVTHKTFAAGPFENPRL